MSIPGYEAAVAKEQSLRALAYTQAPWNVECGLRGIKLRQLTPYLMALLSAAGNPYICEGMPRDSHVAQFLWVLSPDFKPGLIPRLCFRFKIRNLDYSLAARDISEYIKVTFMDSPTGGKESIPYASSIAWLEYYMFKNFSWREDFFLHQTIRRMYQLIRCHRLDTSKGPVVLINLFSDSVKQSDIDKATPPEVMEEFMRKRGQWRGDN